MTDLGSTVQKVEPMGRHQFEQLVAEAIDLVPDELAALISNVAFFVEDVHPDDPELLGLYEGIPLTERDSYGALQLPDRVTVYRLPLCAMCVNEDDIVEEVAVTVVHELAHHFGIDDDRLAELGWD